MATEMIFDKFLEYNDFKIPAEYMPSLSKALMTLIAAYILIVLKIGPSYMKSRAAYDLKSYIVVYNVFQVISCLYLIYKICAIELPTLLFWQCVVPSPKSQAERDYEWISKFTYLLKATELSETLVFVLRKKQRQVSFLHVFHHCATLFLAQQLNEKYKASSAFYPIFLNSIVHVFMYCYYLLAAVLPPKVIAKMTAIKKAITTIQLIQFGLILLQVAAGLSYGCRFPPVILSLYVVIICTFVYLFFDFYRKNYNASRQKVAQS